MVVNAFVGRSEGRVHIHARELHSHTKSIFPELEEQLTAFELLNRIQAALGPEMRPPGADGWMTFEPHDELADYPQLRMEGIEFHSVHHLAFEFQIRTVPGMDDASIAADLRRLLARFEERYPYLRTEVEWPSRARGRQAVAYDRDHPLASSLARWHETVAGERPETGSLGRLGAAADASHVVAAGIDTILYGPGGGTTDRAYRLAGLRKEGPPDERILLDDIVTTAKVFALVAAELCG
jgi:acetylornithine deacetylase/succinyl-diaminopimelate desuccinylase-like protein